MGNEVALHLSGGVFFNLMLAARKKPVANQNQCLKELLYIYDRSAKEMAGNSLVTIASRFRNCDPDLHSDYIRFGDPVVVEEFNGRMRENYASVVGEVKNYADQYLDLEVNGKWLVRALMELVEKDSLIQDNAKFMAIPGGLPAYKQEFSEMHVVYIYNLLIAMTANAFSEDIQHSLAVGMNAHVSKPVEMKVLEKTIRSIKSGGGVPNRRSLNSNKWKSGNQELSKCMGKADRKHRERILL